MIYDHGMLQTVANLPFSLSAVVLLFVFDRSPWKPWGPSSYLLSGDGTLEHGSDASDKPTRPTVVLVIPPVALATLRPPSDDEGMKRCSLPEFVGLFSGMKLGR